MRKLNVNNVSLLFAGDIAFFPNIFSINSLVSKCKDVEKILMSDYKIGNMEFPFSNNKIPRFDNSYAGYIAPFEAIEILKILKFDILTLANNHIMDWGEEGLNTTKYILNNIGLKTCGAGSNIVEARQHIRENIKNINFGFLSYCRPGNGTAKDNKGGTAPLNRLIVINDIKKLKSKVDHIILLIHWGTEFSEYPYPPDRKLAQSFIDAGASCIIGHHPHVVQGMEIYNEKPIFYSLGSFIYNPFEEKVFVSKKLEERLTSIAIKVIFNKNSIVEWNIIPFKNTKGSLIPSPMNQTSKKVFNKKFNILCKRVKEDRWYYSEAINNISSREFSTNLDLLKKTKGLYFLKIIKNIKLRHLKILVNALFNKSKYIVLSKN
jgi:poly-gamma-glutamate capsule biosynthesis protein CapA/YwtB (metallophosphatase superfamily)